MAQLPCDRRWVSRRCYARHVNSLDAAIAALRRDPSRPVRAKVEDLTVELRAVAEEPVEQSATDVFAELGHWESETGDELFELLSERRHNLTGLHEVDGALRAD